MVESPVPASHVQKGLVAEATRPHALTRRVSVKSAAGLVTDAASATRLCTRYPVAAGNTCGVSDRNRQTVTLFMVPSEYSKMRQSQRSRPTGRVRFCTWDG